MEQLNALLRSSTFLIPAVFCAMAAAVEPIAEADLESIHLPGLPITNSGNPAPAPDRQTLASQAHQYELIIDEGTDEPLPEAPALPLTDTIRTTEFSRNNAFADVGHADVVINADRSKNNNHSTGVEGGVNINLANRVEQIQALNTRHANEVHTSRGSYTVNTLSVNVDVVIKAR